MRCYPVEAFGRPLAQVIRDSPEPRGSEVVLRVGSCGLCHSDVHLFDGYFDLGGGAKVDLTRSMQPPRVLGHEIGGTVVAVGPEAEGVRIGDRRVVYPWIGCGSCAVCRSGEEQMCAHPGALGINRDGGFAEQVLVPHPRYLLDYAPLSEEQACTYGCSGITAYGALKKAGALGPDDTLLIIGAGGVGLSGIRLAKPLLGKAPVVADVDPAKAELALAAGAAEVFDPRAEGASRTLVKNSGGGVAVAIDFVGSASSFSLGLGALRKGGKLISVGLIGGSAPIMPAMLPLKALTIVGSYVGSLRDMQELLALARSGTLPELPLARQPLDAVMSALTDLREGRVKGRVILQP